MAGRLPSCSSRKVIAAVVRLGASHVRTKGSHAVYLRETRHGPRTAPIVLNKKDIPEGTLRVFLRQLDISVEEFEQNL